MLTTTETHSVRVIALVVLLAIPLAVMLAMIMIGRAFDDLLHFLVLLAVAGLLLVAEIFNSTVAAVCD
jgi:diacylglycerol kinase